MGFKKFVAAALAAGFCMVSAVTPAKADISNVEVAVDWAEKDTDFVRFSAMGRDIDIADVYGIKITFTCADISGGVGGGLIINCDTNGWDQAEWGNDGAGKAITAVETGNADEYTVTRLLDAPVFQADNTYANFCLSHWWGGDIVITGAEFLGADGKALGAATASSGEVSAEASEGDDAKAPLPKTGLVSSLVFFDAGAVISGAGAMVVKGKKEK